MLNARPPNLWLLSVSKDSGPGFENFMSSEADISLDFGVKHGHHNPKTPKIIKKCSKRSLFAYDFLNLSLSFCKNYSDFFVRYKGQFKIIWIIFKYLNQLNAK